LMHIAVAKIVKNMIISKKSRFFSLR